MLKLSLKAHRGSFQLDVRCEIATQWSVVFGPSGSGKSTLMRLIAGLERPDAGTIQLDERMLTKSESKLHIRPGALPEHRSVAMVAQQSALFPHLNVAENVGYGLAHLLREDRTEQIAAMLNLVGALHLANRSPRQLSGGEAQRISLARALAPMPRLLLLDEPLSSLDSQARDETLSKIQTWLAEKKIQTILVTHDAADALATQAEVLLMKAGRVAAQGQAHEVLAGERNRLLNRLSLLVPMNSLESMNPD